MDKSFLFIIGLLLVSYILGFIFSNKPLSLVINFFRNPHFYLLKLKRFWNSWNDVLFIGLTLLVAVSFFYYFGKDLKIEDKIQTLIVIGTFSSVVFATLVKDKASQYRSRPIIGVEFDDRDPNHYHLTDMHVNQGGAIITSIPTYYIRLKIVNNGKKTLENVEVVVENVEPKPDRFMSLNLSWAGFIVPIPNDIQRTTRLPQKQARIVDLIEVMKPEPTRDLASRLTGAQDTDAKRYWRYAEGFRTCTIKPNTLSDVYPSGQHIFHLGIYADNAEPKFVRISVLYDKNWTDDIEEMRSRHLKIIMQS